jgi:DNA-binding SARP family transcriptional activator
MGNGTRPLQNRLDCNIESISCDASFTSMSSRKTVGVIFTDNRPQIAAAVRPRLEVRFASWSAHVYGNPINLSSTQHALLFAIARSRRPSPREQLVDLIWPDIDAMHACNAFNLSLHRLRRRLGGNDAISYDVAGYSLAQGAVVDLSNLEALARTLRTNPMFSEKEWEALQRVYEQWRNPTCVVFERYEWLESVHCRARILAAEIGTKVGHGWLRRGNPRAALDIANSLIELDACDEHATELALFAHLQLADRSTALRVYRRYEDVITRELGLRPSQHIKALLSEPASPTHFTATDSHTVSQ